MDFLWSLFGFVFAIGILVTIHEAGHYLMARYFNIKVLQFSLGFGKPFWVKQFGETEFRLCPILLGGYVKFVDEREGDVAEEDIARAFNRQSVYKRFLVVLAGPVINLLFAWLAFSLIYFSGIPGIKPMFSDQTISGTLYEQMSNKVLIKEEEAVWEVVSIQGERVYSWQEVHLEIVQALVNEETVLEAELLSSKEALKQQVVLSLEDLDINQPNQNWLGMLGFRPYQPTLLPVIGQVQANSPASAAGLITGDKVLKLGGVQINTWQDLVHIVQANPENVLELVYERQGVAFTRMIHLATKNHQGESVGSLGVAAYIPKNILAPYVVTKSFGMVESLQRGFFHSVDLVNMTLVMIKRMIVGEVSVQNLSGPVSIAQFSGQALESGWIPFLSLLGLLSLSLGVLNLLPIPILDGGHLFFYLIEMVKGSPVSQAVESVAYKVGLLIILSLTFFVIFNDISRIING